MENQTEVTDVGTFLINIARRLTKEGELLQALADKWFADKFSDENEVLTQSGTDIAHLGRKLLVVTDQLCQPCKIKEVSEKLIFSDNSGGSSQKETP